MAVIYNLAAINARLQAVANTIDAGGSNGFLVLLAGSTPISTVQLARPCATVNGGILTFQGTLLDPSASGTGSITAGIFQDSTGATVVSGLSAGPVGASTDIVISNGLSSTLITAGQVVQVLSATITGS